MMKIKKMKYKSNRKIELLFNDIYNGYHFYILNLGTHPTAYIEIPKNNKLFNLDYEKIDLDVHGGLTYSSNKLLIGENTSMENSWFLGWDYAHAGDYMGFYEDFNKWNINTINSLNDCKKWTTEEIIEECKNAIDQIIDFENKGEQNMKISHLLNKIANGVTYTKKTRIRYFDRKNDYEDECILNEVAIGYRLYNQNIELNDEVEILEKEMCHKCHKYPAEYNQTYCEFCLGISKLEEKDKQLDKYKNVIDKIKEEVLSELQMCKPKEMAISMEINYIEEKLEKLLEEVE